MRSWLITLGLLAFGCGQSKQAPAPRPVPIPLGDKAAVVRKDVVPVGLLRNLHMLATGELADSATIERWQRKLSTGEVTLDHYIDELVKHPGFANTVSPRIVMRLMNKNVGNTQAALKLLRTVVDGKTIYHLRKPCAVKDAVSANAWWLDGASVLVCPDSYQPTHLRMPKTDWDCGGANSNPNTTPRATYCGCGKDLMQCYPEELFGAGMKAMQSEVADTIAYVVEKDLPIDQMFLQNETVRSGLADHIYEWWDIANKKLDKPHPLFKGKRLAPRREYFPGMHAGILTSPHLIWMPDAPRPRLDLYSYLLFCNPMKSSRVDPHVVLGLAARDTRDGEGWKRLVKMPGCNTCHARLDYGVQFFSGWIDSRKSYLFHPDKQLSTEGKLYMNGNTDLRGTAKTTPHAFVELALKQPEFARCQAQNVLDYVLGSNATAAMRDAILATASPTLNMRAMMKVALRHYAERYVARTAPVADIATAPGAGTGTEPIVTVSRELKTQLEQYCTDCHDSGQDALPSLEGDKLPRKLLQAAATKVAFGSMPPDGLDEEQRSAFLAPVVTAAWPATAADTASFLRDHMGSLLVHHAESVMLAIRAKRGKEAMAQEPPNMAELRLNQRQAQLTPSFTASVLLEQLKACKLSVKSGKQADIKACMRDFGMDMTVRSPR